MEWRTLLRMLLTINCKAKHKQSFNFDSNQPANCGQIVWLHQPLKRLIYAATFADVTLEMEFLIIAIRTGFHNATSDVPLIDLRTPLEILHRKQ